VSCSASLERAGDVTILRLSAGENRFNPTTLDAIEVALDQLPGDDEPGALVLTGDGKFFSNGLDLEWMASAPPGGAEEVVGRMQAVLAHLLACPTADGRGPRLLCLPEVDIGLAVTRDDGSTEGATPIPGRGANPAARQL
jgi:Enoyl-CoA hydratase/isomerase